ncbi:MAG: dihydrodipicolinate synthase family protein [Candidatus Nealsonbacteria bacterium]|nr:dihydrodipicolinate synthase family protein [Candidatus Nealsonbacteria bacterium]
MTAAETRLPAPLRGIIPPMITPLADRDTLDRPGLERLVEHILAGGVDGLFLLGTSGEGPSLSYRLRCELIERVCEQVGGRVPVLVGVTDASFVESVNLADYAADAGAAAVVLAAPFYFPLAQAELLRYVRRIVAEMPLPVFLYNMPSHTKVVFEPETVRQLLDVPKIVGLKDSSADMDYFRRLRKLTESRADWSLLIGPERLLAEAVQLGGDGGVCGGANLCPRLYVDLYEAARRGNRARIDELHARVMQIRDGIYNVATGAARVIGGLKTALNCLGICNDAMAEPLAPHTDAQRQSIRRTVAELDVGWVEARDPRGG